MPLDVDLDHFPEVPAHNRPRPLYFDTALTPLSTASLSGRGYEVVHLKTLPRRNDSEHMRYLLSRLQGIEEGTVLAGTEDRRRLQLELQTYGMLNPKTTRVNLNVDVTASEVRDLLSWGKTRHTLRDNTTIVGVSELDLHKGGEALLEEKRKQSLLKLQKKKAEVVDAKLLRGESARPDKAGASRPIPKRGARAKVRK